MPWERDRTKNPYSGIATFVSDFDPPSETPAKVFLKMKSRILTLFLKVRVETRAEKDKRKRRDKLERGMKKTEEALEDWNPHEDEKVDSDPFKTLFVARWVFDLEAREKYFLISKKFFFDFLSTRINYDTSESKLKREFEEYGRIRSVSGFFLV